MSQSFFNKAVFLNETATRQREEDEVSQSFFNKAVFLNPTGGQVNRLQGWPSQSFFNKAVFLNA
jgi:hypothetical protein